MESRARKQELKMTKPSKNDLKQILQPMKTILVSTVCICLAGCGVSTHSKITSLTGGATTRDTRGVGALESIVFPAISRAKEQINQGQFQEAANTLNHALELYPGGVELHWELAKVYQRQGNIPMLKRALNDFVHPNPTGYSSSTDAPDRLWEIIQIADEIGDEVLSQYCWDRIVSRVSPAIGYPDIALDRNAPKLSRRSYVKLAIAKGYARKRPEYALRLAKEAVQESPKSWTAHLILADIYDGQGNLVLAKNHLHQCLIRMPNSIKTKQRLVMRQYRYQGDVHRVFYASLGKSIWVKEVRNSDGTTSTVPSTPYPYLTTPPLPPGQ